MTETALDRARLMAKIAGPLLSASIREYSPSATDDPESLAQRFAATINYVVPITQILLDALGLDEEDDHEAIRPLIAPIAAQVVAQNPGLLDDSIDLGRLLKPAIGVLVSFCDRMNEGEKPEIAQDDVPELSDLVLALAPLVGCLSRFSFGKSPAKRLTESLDTLARSIKDVRGSLSPRLARDKKLRLAILGAAAQVFAGHFDAACDTANSGAQDNDTVFKTLQADWARGIGLLTVLIAHAGGEDTDRLPTGPAASSLSDDEEDLPAPSARKIVRTEDEDEGEQSGGGGSGSGGGVKPGYNPMSFFTKKG